MKKPRTAHSQGRAIALRHEGGGADGTSDIADRGGDHRSGRSAPAFAARRRLAQTGATGSGAATAAALRVARLSFAGGPCPWPEDRARPLLDHGAYLMRPLVSALLVAALLGG